MSGKPFRTHRRAFLQSAGAFAAGVTLGPWIREASGAQLPTAPVALGRCRRYDVPEIMAQLEHLFNLVGDFSNEVRGKNVSIKLNLTSFRSGPTHTVPNYLSYYSHPLVTMATCKLLNQMGARRIVLCESLPTQLPTPTAFSDGGYDLALFQSELGNVEFENTRNLGTGSDYARLTVPDGYIYSEFGFNYRYDTDFFISLAKMKNHDIAGITLSMKNLFGIAPNSFYGSDAGSEDATGIRDRVFHNGASPATDGEIAPGSSRDAGFRIPRIIVDLCAARPVDLAIIDGIVSMSGGEGSWNGQQLTIVSPNLLAVGRNPVCTDSVVAAVMGCDPTAKRGEAHFPNGDNTFQLGADKGLGTNRLEEIEVLGMSIREANYAYLPGAKK
jgi:uncharacterized protein (DUF362 family)